MLARAWTLLALSCLFVQSSFGQERPKWETPEPEAPIVSPSSDEAAKSIAAIKIPEGFEGNVFAAEPQLANAVAFFIDQQGRVFVCESYRQKQGIEDNRGHENWLDDDLAARTVEDRYNYVKKFLGDKINDYTKFDDRIKLLIDSDGDHVADRDSVFANRFNEVVAGTGAGVLSYRGKVYYTCIPDLWLLEDKNGDGQAEERRSLHYGFGVRYAFRGHDMHGLIIGPDGKLYFSIGDRGYNVITKDGRAENPDSGAVFRCDLDGSNLEVFATGLRNPQELAFDDFGNLFTGDNNSDSGDRARWVYVCEGGDSGWRMYYQYVGDRGPFNREKIWHPATPGQPGYTVPPITNIADGPSGLTYYPGTGGSDDFKGRFFLCDFRGQPSSSGVRSFRVKPKGAGFELIDEAQPFWNILATDVDFGPDGAVYLLDWVDGWEGLGKGRIYRFANIDQKNSALRLETETLLKNGLAGKSVEELEKLLAHADRRIRQEAQFTLVGQNALSSLVKVAKSDGDLLSRLHAIWGLGQLGRNAQTNASEIEATLVQLLSAGEEEVKAQAAKVVGELKLTASFDGLVALLKDSSSRVRYFAAISLGKIGSEKGVEPLSNLLAENNNADVYLRHGGIMGLTGIAAKSPASAELVALKNHPSAAVRLAAVVAYRKVKSELVGEFLKDGDVSVVLEAARAIHDADSSGNLPALASLIQTPADDDALLRRVLNANYRVGGAERALALATFAARTEQPEHLRIEAIEMLATWNNPVKRDRVTGQWRPIEAHDAMEAKKALQTALARIISGGGNVAKSGINAAGRLGITEISPELLKIVGDKGQDGKTRADALLALDQLQEPKLGEILPASLKDDSVFVRVAALEVAVRKDFNGNVAAIKTAIDSNEVLEKQMALALLQGNDSAAAAELLVAGLKQLKEGKFAPEASLELVESSQASQNGEVQKLLGEYKSSLADSDHLRDYRLTLAGGDIERGRKLFFERTALSCVRCHKVSGTGGDVGPELSLISKEKSKEYLLEAIVDPNKQIAKGFETILIQTSDGTSVSGILKERNDKVVKLQTAEGTLIEVPVDSIEDEGRGNSSMPNDLIKNLSKKELRDLVEYLSTLK